MPMQRHVPAGCRRCDSESQARIFVIATREDVTMLKEVIRVIGNS